MIISQGGGGGGKLSHLAKFLVIKTQGAKLSQGDNLSGY